MLSEIDPHKVEEIKLCLVNTGSLHRLVETAVTEPGGRVTMVSQVGRTIQSIANTDCKVKLSRYEALELLTYLVDYWDDQGWPKDKRQRFKERIEVVKLQQHAGPPTQAMKNVPKPDDHERQLEKTIKFAQHYGTRLDAITRTMQGADLQIQNLPKEPDMTKPIKIETKHFIQGQDVSTLEDAAVWSLIAAQERALKDLKAIENQPQSLKDHIAEIEAGIKGLVDFLDARAKKAA